MKTLLTTFLLMLLSSAASAFTTLTIAEKTAGTVNTVEGSALTVFEVSADYPLGTDGFTQLVLTLTDGETVDSTQLFLPVVVDPLDRASVDNQVLMEYQVGGIASSPISESNQAAVNLLIGNVLLDTSALASGIQTVTVTNTDTADSLNSFSLFFTNFYVDSDGDGIANGADTDDDNDGIPDESDQFPLNALATIDTDQDGIADELDTDDDNDGIPDSEDSDPLNVESLELGPVQVFDSVYSLGRVDLQILNAGQTATATQLQLGQHGSDVVVVDVIQEEVQFDGNRQYDTVEITVSDSRSYASTITLPLTLTTFLSLEPLPGFVEVGSSLVSLASQMSGQSLASPDGMLAVFDTEIEPAEIGESSPYLLVETALTVPEGLSTITSFADRSVDDDLIVAFLDNDLDDDGFNNADDAYPEDPNRMFADLDGDGLSDDVDTDDDGDGVDDVDDAFPEDASEWLDTDGDLIGNNADTDDDGDGVLDVADAAPLDATKSKPSRLINIATRAPIRTGNEVLIGGLIIGGTEPKTVVIRAIGPSLIDFGLNDALVDPTLELYSGATRIDLNDDWQQHANAKDIPAHLVPTNMAESAIMTTLDPGPYTAIVRGFNEGQGIGLVEILEVSDTDSSVLVNIATRGYIGTGNEVLIGGLIIGGDVAKTVTIRARGPSMIDVDSNLEGQVVMDPYVELYSGQTKIDENDDWQAHSSASVIREDLKPSRTSEAAITVTLEPGPYTAIVRGVGGTTGIGIVEVFAVD